MEVQKHKKWEWEREQGRDPKIKMVSQLFFDIPHFNSCEWCIFNVVEGLGQQGGAVVPSVFTFLPQASDLGLG